MRASATRDIESTPLLPSEILVGSAGVPGFIRSANTRTVERAGVRLRVSEWKSRESHADGRLRFRVYVSTGIGHDVGICLGEWPIERTEIRPLEGARLADAIATPENVVIFERGEA